MTATDIEGRERMLRNFEKATGAALMVAEKAADDGGAIIEHAAGRLAPGPHITRAISERTTGRVSIDIGPDKDHWYYRFFETGTSAHEVNASNLALKLMDGDDQDGPGFIRIVEVEGIPASPFMRPSLDENQKRVEQVVGDSFWSAIMGAIQ